MNKYQNLPELFFSKAKENLKNQHLLKINTIPIKLKVGPGQILIVQ